MFDVGYFPPNRRPNKRARRIAANIASVARLAPRGAISQGGGVCFAPADSTDQCNTACSLSAGVSKPKVFRGR